LRETQICIHFKSVSNDAHSTLKKDYYQGDQCL
jgi:hypothetical protein